MKLRGVWVFPLAAAVWLSAFSERAAAQAMAQDSAIVQPAGPESGDNGKNFVDVIGRGNSPTNPSFSVIEFSAADLGLGQVSEVDSLSLTLTQSLFALTSRGPMAFYITTNTTISIQPDPVNPAIIFDLNLVSGIDSHLADLYSLGGGEFLPVRSGWQDTFTFTIDLGSPAEAYLVGQINSGGIIRVVIAPDMDDVDMELVGGSYAGSTNLNPAAIPVLTVAAQ